MKVVQVLPDLDGGGVEKGTLEVAQALVAAGHESVVVSAGGRLVAPLEAAGSRHYRWDLGRKSLLTFRHIWAVRRWLQKEQPDILHLRSRMPAWVMWLAWRGLPSGSRPHLVTTVHGLYSVSAYSAIMTRGERVIAVSDTIADYIRTNYPQTPDQKITRIFRGVDPADFPYQYQPSESWLAQYHQDFPQLAGRKVLMLPGRLTRLKGHHDFIELIARLHDKGEPVAGLIVGGEDPKRQAYAQELRQIVADKGLEEVLFFTGARADIRELYSCADVVLSLSTKPEAFGRTVAEALTQGVPVVGYDHGGVGEILRALYPQGLSPLSDLDALEANVTALLDTPVAPKPNQHFLKAEMLQSTLTLYKELVT